MTSFLRMNHGSYQTSPHAAMIPNRLAQAALPINLISDLYFEDKEMCMSLPSSGSSVILAVCDGSNSQKWYNVGNTLQSFINEDMCLDAGVSASQGAFLTTAQCDDTSSQDWMIDTASSTIVNAEHSTFIMANDCELSSANTNVLIQSILAGRYVLLYQIECPLFPLHASFSQCYLFYICSLFVTAIGHNLALILMGSQLVITRAGVQLYHLMVGL